MEWEDFIEQLLMQLPGGQAGGNSEPWEAPEPGEEPEPTLEPNFLDPNSTLYKMLTNDTMGVSLEQLAELEELPPLPVTEAPITQDPVTLATLNDTLALQSSVESNSTLDNTTETTALVSFDSTIKSILSSIKDTLVGSVETTTSRPSNRIYGTTPSPRQNPNPLGRTKVDVKPPSYQGSLTFHFANTVNHTVISNSSAANVGQIGTSGGAQVQVPRLNGKSSVRTPIPTANVGQIGTSGGAQVQVPRLNGKTSVRTPIPTANVGQIGTSGGAQVQVPRLNGKTSVPTPTPTPVQRQIDGTQAPSRISKLKTTAMPSAKSIHPSTSGEVPTFIDAPLVGSQSDGITPAPKGIHTNIPKVVQTKPVIAIRAKPTSTSPQSAKVNAAMASPVGLQRKTTDKSTPKASTTTPSLLSIQAKITVNNTQRVKTTRGSPSSIKAKTIVKTSQKSTTTTQSPLSTQRKSTERTTQKPTIRPTTLHPLLRQAINNNNPLAWWTNRNKQAVDNMRNSTPSRLAPSGTSSRVSRNRPPNTWQSNIKRPVSRIQADTRSWWSNWRARGGGNAQSSPISPTIVTTGIQTPSGVSTLQNQLRGRIGTSGVNNSPLSSGTSGRILRQNPIRNDFNIRRRTGTISNVVYVGPDKTAEIAMARASSGKIRSHGSISLFGMIPQPLKKTTKTSATTTTGTAAVEVTTTTATTERATVTAVLGRAEIAVDVGSNVLSIATNTTKKSTTAAPTRLATSPPSGVSNVTEILATDPTPAVSRSMTSSTSKPTQNSATVASAKTATGTLDPQTTPLPLAALPAALHQINQGTPAPDNALPGRKWATK
ncbi:mucin-2-like [Liolophura sinensis]|uniref:mucin-2-like n=1 Tax=Liolophura sinensis TaxID=3198878 RepID=UPI003159403F